VEQILLPRGLISNLVPGSLAGKSEGNFSQQAAQSVDATDAGNKLKFVSDKKADGFEAITYFDHMKEVTLTWAEALFHDGKVDSYGDNADVMEE
jgi:hypothetical protein